jgi:hypothetical protein
MPAGARTRIGSHRVPEIGLGRIGQRVAVAVPAGMRQRVRHVGIQVHPRFGGVAPREAFAGLLVLEEVVVPISRAARHAVELELADVATTPLGQRKAKRLGHLRRQGGQVLVDELLLERHGGGGDQHPRVARQRQRDGRRAVGQRLAHAGAGLDHGDRAHRLGRVVVRLAQRGLGKSAGHLFGHLALAGAVAKADIGRDDGIECLQGVGGERGQGHGPSVAWRSGAAGSCPTGPLAPRACALRP